jgi:glycosyltransferase involved in cell wall biosynthesis
MKVLIVLDSLNRAGAERQALYAVGEMTRQGHDVELIYYNKATEEYDTALAAPAVVRRLPKNGEKLRFLWKLTRYLRRGRYDVVHAFMSATSIYVGLAGWLAGVPVRLGGMRSEYDGVGLVRLCHRIVNRLLTGWICNSEATRRSLQPGVGAALDRIFVVYNGIKPEVLESSLSSAEAKLNLGFEREQPIVTLIGRLTHQKNVSLFLQAAALVARQRPHAGFLVVGAGELDTELRAQAANLSLSDCVRFLGVRSDIPDILRATDVLTLTSHYEGISNTLLEAMAVGIPVVSTAYAGVEELLTDAVDGFVVPMGDAHGLAEKYVQLIDDAGLRMRIGAAGKDAARGKFTIEALGANLFSVYERTYRAVCGNGAPA